jgi:hypothetical protein
VYLDKRLNVGSLSSPSQMLWQTILRYWIAKILQAMLKEVRERRGEEMLHKCFLNVQNFMVLDERHSMTILKSSALLAVSSAPSGIINRLV